MDADTETLKRRREKFSKESLRAVKDDPLKDVSLLSRGNTQADEQLNTMEKREAFILRLSKLDDDKESLEHGLRKIREVLVSCFDSESHNARFIFLCEQVYQMTYDLLLAQQKIDKLALTVLEFIVSNQNSFHEEFQISFWYIYILYFGLSVQDLEKCLAVAVELRRTNYKYDSQTLDSILDLALVYNLENDSPAQWFSTLSHIKSDKLLKFIDATGALNDMHMRCLKLVTRCYNQISMEFLQNYWFCSASLPIAVRNIVSRDYLVTENEGHQVIHFKRRPTG